MFGGLLNAGRMAWGFLKGGTSALTGLGVAAGAGGAAELSINGRDGFVGNLIKDVQEGIGSAGAQAHQDITKTGIFSFLKMLGEIAMVLTKGKWGQGLIDMSNEGVVYDSDRHSAADLENGIASPTSASGGSPTASNNPPGTVPGSDLAGVATMGASAAATGVRSVPLLGSAFAAGTGLWDTGSYLLQGDVKRAGVRFTSGVADTVLSAGGFLSMAFATAARETIEEGAQLAFGDQVDMPDSPTLRIAKAGLDLIRN